MHQRYRKDYDGEFVVVDTIVAENSTSQKREWIPNAVENHHVSGRAAAIATGEDYWGRKNCRPTVPVTCGKTCDLISLLLLNQIKLMK